MTDWRDISGLVADGVRLAHSDRVSVFFTDAVALPAVRAFVEEAYRRGALPQVLDTDERFDHLALKFAPDEQLSAPPPLEAAAMSWSDVHVSFRAMVPPLTERQPDPRRIALLRHGRGLISTMRWQETRWAIVRIPTPEWCAAVGVDAVAVEREWQASFAADWREAEERMRRLCDRLEDESQLVIVDADTELALPTAGRRWVPFSGSANWPDGELATAPVETAVRGHITFPGLTIFAGARVRDLRLDFKAGEVVRASASEGAAVVEQLLETDQGARRVGELGIGTNRALRTMTGDLLLDEKILGTAHIALGRAYPECGGVNESALHWDIVKDLRGPAASLYAGAIELIRDGHVQESLAAAAVA